MGRTENAPDRRARLKNETSGLDSKIKVKKTAVLRSLGLWSRAFLRRRRSESGEELVETLIQKGDVIVDGGEEGNPARPRAVQHTIHPLGRRRDTDVLVWYFLISCFAFLSSFFCDLTNCLLIAVERS